mgnify:FL=1
MKEVPDPNGVRLWPNRFVASVRCIVRVREYPLAASALVSVREGESRWQTLVFYYGGQWIAAGAPHSKINTAIRDAWEVTLEVQRGGVVLARLRQADGQRMVVRANVGQAVTIEGPQPDADLVRT